MMHMESFLVGAQQPACATPPFVIDEFSVIATRISAQWSSGLVSILSISSRGSCLAGCFLHGFSDLNPNRVWKSRRVAPTLNSMVVKGMAYRASDDELMKLIASARDGDEEAYRKIRTDWNGPLIGLMRRLAGWPADQAGQVAELIWTGQRDQILRSARRDGYRIGPMPPTNRPRLFHTYVLMDCTSWGRVLAKGAEITPTAEPDLSALEFMADPNAPAPSETLQRLQSYESMFAVVCDPRTGYPHQQITFIFSKYFFGRGQRGLHGDTLRTDAECGDRDLDMLLDRLKRDLNLIHERYAGANREWIDRALEPMNNRLELSVARMFRDRKDTQSIDRFGGLLEALVGTTAIRDYYPKYGGDEADVRRQVQNLLADWCRKVGTKIRQMLEVEGIQ